MELPAGTYRVSYAEDMAVVGTKLQWCLLIALLIFLLTLPLFAGSYLISIVIVIAINIVAVHGLNLLSGYCGQISLGHSAFAAVGGYASCLLSTNLGFPFWIALPLAGLSAGLVGLIFGFPSLRIKGFYLIMSTVAAQFIIGFILLLNPYGLTGGAFGLSAPPPSIGNIVFDSTYSYYYIAVPVCMVMTFLAKNLARMDIGRAFVALRDNDIAAESMGINLFRTKLAAFFIGCFFAGIAGSLWAHYVRTIVPDTFTLHQSIWYLGMLIIGGMGSTLGIILGVIFVKLLDEASMLLAESVGAVLPALGAQGWAAFGLIFFGVVVVLFLVFEPRGLAHRWALFKASYRLWPFSD